MVEFSVHAHAEKDLENTNDERQVNYKRKLSLFEKHNSINSLNKHTFKIGYILFFLSYIFFLYCGTKDVVQSVHKTPYLSSGLS